MGGTFTHRLGLNPVIASGAVPVAVTSVSAGSLPNVSSLDLTFPAVLSGDIALLHIFIADGSGSAGINEVSGWTNDAALYEPLVYDFTARVAWLRCTGNEDGTTVTVTTTESINTGYITATLSVWRGCVATGTPYEASGRNSSDTNTTAHAGSDVTTTGTNRRVVSVFGVYNGLSTGTNTNGWDEFYDVTFPGIGLEPSMSGSSVAAPTAGVVSACTRTQSVSTRYSSMTVALLPT